MFRKKAPMKVSPTIRHLLFITALITVIFTSECVSREPLLADHWFRGNTHAHTELCGHADSSPDVVTAWYHDHGYNFLILSEHNQFIDPNTVKLPENRRKNFILIPGMEITGKKHIHSTAMNVQRVVPWKFNHINKSAIIQNHVDGTIKAGGQPILNHPFGKDNLVEKDILPVHNLYMFELFNGHNAERWQYPPTENLWDQLLSKGMLIYGVSSDDAHRFQKTGKSNPGRGWVMVRSSSLDPETITKAMSQGNFYSSNGVFLKTYNNNPDTYLIEVDTQRTKQELTSLPDLRGKHINKGTEGYRVEFIGPNGDILDTIKGTKGRFNINSSIAYVRAKVTFTHKHPRKDGFEEYYAWGQPVFTDARAGINLLKHKRHDKPNASGDK